MVSASQEFDQRLFELKLSELSREMQIKSRTSYNKKRAASQGTGRSYLMDIVDCQLALLRDEWLKGIDRIAREVWQIQGKALTAAFVRDVLVPNAMTLIGTRNGVIKSTLERAQRFKSPYPAQHHLAMEIRKVTGELTNRYEIEARTLEHMNAPIKVTKAPAPVTPVGGLGVAPYRPNPIRIPPNPPTYFTGDLWPQTNVILLEGRRKFPLQTQTFELCKYVVAEMTPLFCDAVKTGKMSPDQVLRKHGGGMEDLLDSLLVYNDSGPRNGFTISDIAFRLGEKVRESDEWLALAKTIVEAQHISTGAGGNADRTEGSRVQNNAKTADPASTNGGVILRVCSSSATFCSWLERQALEQSAPGNGTGAERLRTGANPPQSSLPRNGDKQRRLGGNWFDAGLDTVRRRQVVLRNPKMLSPSLCKVLDGAAPPIPLPRDWQSEFRISTWLEAYKNPIARKRIQKIISTDRQTGKT